MSAQYMNNHHKGGLVSSFAQIGTVAASKTAGSHVASIAHAAQRTHQAVRTPVSEKCAVAVYERRLKLKDVVNDMAGDYLVNKKLVGDIFLSDNVKMNIEQAACLAYAFHLESTDFIDTCERTGMLIPLRE